MSDLPVACTLTDAELRQRRQWIIARVWPRLLGHEELPEGWSFRFPTGDDTLGLLAQLVDAERQCCPFLRFQLTVGPGEGPVMLDVTGPDGSKSFVASLFPANQ